MGPIKKGAGSAVVVEDDELLRMKEVAVILHCSIAQVYRLAANGTIPTVGVGTGLDRPTLRTPRSQLMKWIANNSNSSAA